VVAQGVVFAVIHPLNELQNGKGAGAVFWDARWALVNIFLIAVFFAQCYRKTGSLWFPIGFHAAWNFFLGCVWSLPVSGIQTFRLLDVVSSSDSTLSGGSFGAEGSIFLTCIIAALVYVMSRMPDHPQANLDLALLVNYPGETATAGIAEPEEEGPEEGGPSRFKTSMRPVSTRPQLSPEFFRTESSAAVSPTATAEEPGDERFKVDVSDDVFSGRASQSPVAVENAENGETPPSLASPDEAETEAVTKTVIASPEVQAPVDSQNAGQPLDAPATSERPPVPVEPGIRPKRGPRW